MSPILATLLFAAIATAQTTTSVWLPSVNYDSDQVGYYASIVGADNQGRVTMAVVYDNDTDTSYIGVRTNTPNTITVAGNTYFEAKTTTTSRLYTGDYTVSMACSRTGTRARPTCSMSQGGALAYEAYCGYYESYTQLHRTQTLFYTRTNSYGGSASVSTSIRTYDLNNYGPSWCTGSTLPASIAMRTLVLPQSISSESYQVVITAGQEKLAATTGGSVPPATASATATLTGPAASNTTGSPTGAATSGPQRTGAAPLVTPAAALAAVAMAAFAL